MTKPFRIQRKRVKGWKMPPNTVYVGRPTTWGNPYDWRRSSREKAVEAFRTKWAEVCAAEPLAEIRLRRNLGGKNLSCWCPLDQPCHADILLELANA